MLVLRASSYVEWKIDGYVIKLKQLIFPHLHVFKLTALSQHAQNLQGILQFELPEMGNTGQFCVLVKTQKDKCTQISLILDSS